MKVLVLGGGGQVARAVAAAVPAGHSVVVKSRADLDIADAAAMAKELAITRYDWMVNGAAYTAVDLAETNVEEARRVNDTAVGIVARAAAAADCRLLHLSTDFVFDGTGNRAYAPDSVPNPLSVYGSSKLGGERQALEQAARSLVLRTSWVYASSGRNFALTMLRLMRERPEVRVVCDQIGTPTWASSVARAVWGLIDADPVPGIYQWTDLGVASWYDFAVAIQDEGLTRGLVPRAIPIVPITTREYPTPALRPAFSVLDTRTTSAAIGIPGRHWRHSLRMMLDELRTS